VRDAAFKGQTIYVSDYEGFQAVPARPSGRGRLKRWHSEAKDLG
jgi:hypothetical protein